MLVLPFVFMIHTRTYILIYITAANSRWKFFWFDLNQIKFIFPNFWFDLPVIRIIWNNSSKIRVENLSYLLWYISILYQKCVSVYQLKFDLLDFMNKACPISLHRMCLFSNTQFAQWNPPQPPDLNVPPDTEMHYSALASSHG